MDTKGQFSGIISKQKPLRNFFPLEKQLYGIIQWKDPRHWFLGLVMPKPCSSDMCLIKFPVMWCAPLLVSESDICRSSDQWDGGFPWNPRVVTPFRVRQAAERTAEDVLRCKLKIRVEGKMRAISIICKHWDMWRTYERVNKIIRYRTLKLGRLFYLHQNETLFRFQSSPCRQTSRTPSLWILVEISGGPHSRSLPFYCCR